METRNLKIVLIQVLNIILLACCWVTYPVVQFFLGFKQFVTGEIMSFFQAVKKFVIKRENARYIQSTDFLFAIKSGFVNCINFKGRTSRKEFWYFICFLTLIRFFVFILSGFFPQTFYQYGRFSMTFGELIPLTWNIIITLLLCSLIFRRLHDVGQSGWNILFIIPWFVGCIFLLPVFWFYTRVIMCTGCLISSTLTLLEIGPLFGSILLAFGSLPFSLIVIFFSGIFGLFLLGPLLRDSKKEEDQETLEVQATEEEDEELKKIVLKPNKVFLVIDITLQILGLLLIALFIFKFIS